MNKTPTPNVQIRYIPDPNPWETLTPVPKLHPVGSTLLALLVLAAALYHPAFAPHTAYSLALLAVCTVVLAALVRSLMVGIMATVLFSGGYLVGILLGMDGLTVGVAVISCVVAIGIGAFLITACRSKALILVPIAAYATAALISRDFVLALIVLVPFPAMGLLAYNTMCNRSRVGSICLTTICYGVCLAFGLALLHYRTAGPTTLDELFRALQAAREQTIELMLSNEAFTTFVTEQYKDAGISAEMLATVCGELLFNLLPALVITAINLVSYTAQLLCVRTYATTGLDTLITKTAQLFILSILSAIVYVICFIIAIFPGEMTAFSAAVYNILLIQMPGMTLVGAYKLISDIRHGVSKIWLFILIGCALFAPYMLIFCISFSGALTTLTRPLIARLLLKQGGNHSDSNGPESK